LLGFGNVARAFARFLGESRVAEEIQIRAIADSTGGVFIASSEHLDRLIQMKESGLSLRNCSPHDCIGDPGAFIDALRNSGVQAVVESLPNRLEDGEPALSLLRRLLAAGIPVVTVNKGPLVHGWVELEEAARAGGARLACSGATGVQPPAELRDCRTVEIQGILNGTVNHILSAMQMRSLTFAEGLAEARSLGIAEPDPRMDIEGWDAACKIVILSNRWMSAGARLDDVTRIAIGPETESLAQTARASQRRLRLLSRARMWQGRVRLSVVPKLVTPGSPFYALDGVRKGALFRTGERGDLFVEGRSGRQAISEIILGDVMEIRGRAQETRS
jgi:homoserine dehydrogenase